MEEEDQIFDPTMKKKKKKKKTAFDPESMGGEEPVAQTEEAVDETVDAPKDEPAPITDDFEADFSQMKKKKKKKKVDFGEMDDAPPAKEEPAAPAVPEVGAEEDMDAMTAGFEELDLKKKKKKKTKKLLLDDDDAADTKVDDEDESATTEGHAWKDTDRDYTYEELLVRVFDIMREKNPEMVAGEKRRFVMKPPQISKAGAKKTAFANFAEICKMLHRQPKHLLAFLLAELGTSGSIDGSNSLIIKGRFHQKQLETVLRRYIKEYVTCHTCKSPETILQRDTRIYFLQCETCGSRCSVQSIKSGFQAVTSKRAAIRAKTS